MHRDPIRLSVNFSTETMQARREWDQIFKGNIERKNANHAVLQQWRAKDFPGQFKDEGVHYH